MATRLSKGRREAHASDPLGITVAIPGRPEIVLRHLVTDFTGTLAKDGRLLPGVAARLRHLAKDIHIIAATADTFGTARRALAGLPVDVRFVKTGGDKARIIRNLGPTHVVVIGNGQNDVPMFGVAALSVAVVGPEGAAGQVLSAAEVVVGDVKDALDLLANPLRLAATLRE